MSFGNGYRVNIYCFILLQFPLENEKLSNIIALKCIVNNNYYY